MAGMFYSLEEVAEKLNKTEEEVKEIVREGKLREFRDGSNLLFKIDEVEALISGTAIMESEESPSGTKPQPEQEELSLESEPDEDTVAGSELTSADTAVAAEGINILEETESDYNLSDDTTSENTAESGEASLEEIEKDVNLDTFGSGSGLLDLSLQADDTSLGGILDEIYTPEDNEVQQTTGTGSAVEMAAETEQMLSEEDFAIPQSSPETAAMVQAYVEPEPDAISNALGIMLFLPLLAVIYTAIVAVTGFNGIMPAILEKTQNMIWYIAGGTVIASILIVGTAFLLSGEVGKTGKKQKAEQPPPSSENEQEAS